MKKNYYKERFATYQEWRKQHKKFIGGSASGVLLGVSKYKNKLELYNDIINGNEADEDENNRNEVQKFGVESEPLIRKTFALNFPEYKVTAPKGYESYIRNDKSYIGASVDGILTHRETKKKYILEIKTRDIRRKGDLEEWDNQIPQSYFAQCIHYLMVMNDCQGVKLVAQLRFFDFDQEDSDKVKKLETRIYHIERSEVEEDIKALEQIETDFWNNNVSTLTPPNYERGIGE